MNCCIILGAILTLSGHASAEGQTLQQQGLVGVHDEVVLLQAWTGIKMRQKEAMLEAEPEVGSGFDDSSSFAQTQVEVNIAGQEEAASARVGVLSDLQQQQQQQQ
mmetsp:Transcript_46733/g.135234  ORF Transcript_46733/g.135234 Transcript_46733/m.135234 type:complete len:105 (-) Transcript_46733:16-330(-)